MAAAIGIIGHILLGGGQNGIKCAKLALRTFVVGGRGLGDGFALVLGIFVHGCAEMVMYTVHINFGIHMVAFCLLPILPSACLNTNLSV